MKPSTTSRTYRYAFKGARTLRSVGRSTRGMAKLVYGPLLKTPSRVKRSAKNVAQGAKAGWAKS